MPDYKIFLRSTIPSNAEQRARQMTSWLQYQPPYTQPWAKPCRAPEIEADLVSEPP